MSFKAQSTDAYDRHQIDETTFVERYPKIETDYLDPQLAAVISEEVDVNAGDVFMYYHKVDEYCDVYDQAVNDLSHLLLKQDDLGIVSNKVHEYAKSAFALEPTGDMPQHEWRDCKDEVIQLRLELDDEYIEQLSKLKNEIKERGHEIQQELGRAKADLRQEYHISRADL
ncbi:hypothetical protein C438_04432 [Haloferax denitrificans ATCC 35960]|uniref:Uncharacterized protein n=2 Tax=Haloferax denitrificans TaxID=35745 RepID=M0JHK0_9EURY|nr:hypothetical protein C438_04432 [Haloferax denitrificans ATCC 35960]